MSKRVVLLDNAELDVDYRDVGPWRSYSVYAELAGDLEDTIADAAVIETDQDGGELVVHGVGDYSGDVYRKASAMIEAAYEKYWRNRDEAAKEYYIDQKIDERKCQA